MKEKIISNFPAENGSSMIRSIFQKIPNTFVTVGLKMKNVSLYVYFFSNVCHATILIQVWIQLSSYWIQFIKSLHKWNIERKFKFQKQRCNCECLQILISLIKLIKFLWQTKIYLLYKRWDASAAVKLWYCGIKIYSCPCRTLSLSLFTNETGAAICWTFYTSVLVAHSCSPRLIHREKIPNFYSCFFSSQLVYGKKAQCLRVKLELQKSRS